MLISNKIMAETSNQDGGKRGVLLWLWTFRGLSGVLGLLLLRFMTYFHEQQLQPWLEVGGDDKYCV